MHIDSNNISEFETWIKEEESLGAKNLMSFFMWPNEEENEIKKEVISALTEVIVFNIFWVLPIKETICSIIQNRSNILLKDDSNHYLITSQLTYYDAFQLLQSLNEGQRYKILNDYCKDSHLFNGILNAISQNNYDVFVDVLGNENHIILMRYLWLLQYVSIDIEKLYDMTSFFFSGRNKLDEKEWFELELDYILKLLKRLYENDIDVQNAVFSTYLSDLPSMIRNAEISNDTQPISHCNFYPHFIKNIKSELSNKRKAKQYLSYSDPDFLPLRLNIFIKSFYEGREKLGLFKDPEIEDVFEECGIDDWETLKEDLEDFEYYIVYYTSELYVSYNRIKPFLDQNEINMLEWYLNSSEYYNWYNNVMLQSNETDHRISISNSEDSKQSLQEEAGNSLSNIPTINCNDTDLSDEKMVERLKAVYLKTLNRRKNLQDHKLIIPLVKFLQESYLKANFGEIAYIIFNSESIKPSKKLILINDVKSFILFISYLFNRKIPKEVWAYLGYYIVDSDGKPIFPIDINDMEYKENPIRGRYRSEDLKNYHKEIQKGIIRYLKADEEYLLKEINQIK